MTSKQITGKDDILREVYSLILDSEGYEKIVNERDGFQAIDLAEELDYNVDAQQVGAALNWGMKRYGLPIKTEGGNNKSTIYRLTGDLPMSDLEMRMDTVNEWLSGRDSRTDEDFIQEAVDALSHKDNQNLSQEEVYRFVSDRGGNYNQIKRLSIAGKIIDQLKEEGIIDLNERF